MVNHVRALLRNTDPEPYAGQDGWEFTDPSFVPVVLPGYLAAVRTILFGRRPDRAALDLKLRRYMALLHATALAEDVLVDDPRITYAAPVVDRLEFDFTPRIVPIGHDAPLYLSGDLPGEDSGGALDHAWRLTVAADEIAVEQLRPGRRQFVGPVAYDRDLSAPVELSGSGLRGRFHAGVPDEAGWLVTCLARPGADPGVVLASLGQLGEDVLARLFGVPPRGRYVTWRLVWDSDAAPPYRLGAALLALAARTDEVRRR